jgi:DNA modification methylase
MLIFVLLGELTVNFVKHITDAGFKIKNCIVWDKKSIGLGLRPLQTTTRIYILLWRTMVWR